MVVRSHSTPVTVWQLATAQAYPVRVFGFSRCCRARPEKPEFLQMDVLVADAGLNVSTLLGTIKRADGSLQVTYKGHPLYRYIKDKDDGDTYGEGIKSFGAAWYALAPSGKKVDLS